MKTKSVIEVLRIAEHSLFSTCPGGPLMENDWKRLFEQKSSDILNLFHRQIRCLLTHLQNRTFFWGRLLWQLPNISKKIKIWNFCWKNSAKSNETKVWNNSNFPPIFKDEIISSKQQSMARKNRMAFAFQLRMIWLNFCWKEFFKF